MFIDLVPRAGATGVPPDVRFFVGESDLHSAFGFVLEGPEGEVALESSILEVRSERPAVHVFTPAAPLVAGASYVLSRPGAQPTRFTVGHEPAAGPPAPPTVDRILTSTGDDGCGPEAFAVLQTVPDPTVALTVLRLGNAPVAEGPPPARFDDLSVGELYAGTGGCFRNWDAAPGLCTTARVGAFDFAGRFSGWSEPFDVCIPDALPPVVAALAGARAGAGGAAAGPPAAPPGAASARAAPASGCTAAPGPASAPALLTLLALLRRRAR